MQRIGVYPLLFSRFLSLFFAREGVRAALILIVVLHVCFAPFIWGSKTFLESAKEVPSILPQGALGGSNPERFAPQVLDPGAPGWQSEPLLALLHHEYFEEGTIPLWNPYQGYGIPLAANMLSQPFFPLTAALSAVINPISYNWLILLRLFIAGLCTYFYLRLFIGFFGSLAGGVAAMLSGYYMLYITMFHLSVETLVPAALLAAECLLRKQNAATAGWFIAVIWLSIVGGMPESTLVLMSLLFAYILVRSAMVPEFRSNARHNSVWLVISTVAGFALAAFLLLPFYEFLRHSFDTHQPHNLGGRVRGTQFDFIGRSIVTYLFPLLFGPAQSKGGPSGIRNYIGIVPLFLILISTAALFFRKKLENRTLPSLTIFFLSVFVFVLLKRYGFAGVNWIGSLPGYQLLDFAKYDEVLLSISAAILCGIGVDHLVNRRLPFLFQFLCLALPGVLIPITSVLCRRAIHEKYFISPTFRQLAHWAVGVPAVAVVSLLIAVVLLNRTRIWYGQPANRASAAMGVCLLILLTAELNLNYLIPAYYSFGYVASASSNPYRGAPFIDVLKRHIGRDRIFAYGNVLHPEWSSAFGLTDIRDVDAMYNDRYLLFVRNFFLPNSYAGGEDLGDRFIGVDYDPWNPGEQRLLQLSSVRLMAASGTYPSNRIINRMLSQAPPDGHFAKKNMKLDGIGRQALGEHPPYRRFPYRVSIGERQSVFHFAYGIDPDVFDKPGDGVGFTLEIRDATGHVANVFSKYIDPKHDPSERHWEYGQADISRYRGQTIEFLFSTDPGPKNDTTYDWAAWADFHFDNTSEETPPVPEIYRGEANIYQLQKSLPRAAVFYNAEFVNGDAAVLRRLADPSLNIFQTVVLDSAQISVPDRQRIANLNQATAAAADAAAITSYKSQTVDIRPRLGQNGILVLNDSAFPGWTVEVDGKPARWFTANYLFRGVLLPAGDHTVRYAYKPVSFYAGAGISAVTFVLLIPAAFFARKRTRFARPEYAAQAK